jgi:hypothetical protein
MYALDAEVYADYSCDDAGDGAASCQGYQGEPEDGNTVNNGEVIDTSTAGSHSFTVIGCADDDGEFCNTVTHTYTVVAPPNVEITTPEANGVYFLNEVVNADYECTDAGSGVASCEGYQGDPEDGNTVDNGDPIDTSAVGSYSFTVIGCADGDGVFCTTVTHNYTVIYDFDGFFRPLDPDPEAFNVMRAGAAAPIKFSLNGDQGLDIIKSVESYQINCDSNAEENELLDAETAGKSSLSYDADSDTYNWVWKTERGWGGSCRVFVLTLDDDMQYTAKFQFR